MCVVSDPHDKWDRSHRTVVDIRYMNNLAFTYRRAVVIRSNQASSCDRTVLAFMHRHEKINLAMELSPT